MKKLLALGVCLVLGFSAYASGRTEDAAAAREQVEITWLTWETAQLTPALYDEIIANFEAANPDIRVRREAFPSGDREQYMKTLYASNLMPDITMGGVYDLAKVDGALAPLPDTITSLFDAAALSEYDGEVRYVPTVKQLSGNIFYNRDIFEQYGLTPPDNWAEFIEICEALQENGVVPLMGGGPDKPFLTGFMLHNPMLSTWLHELDPNYPTLFASGQWHWDDPAILDIVGEWRSLVDRGFYHPGSMSFTYDQYQQAFMQGEAAMIVDGVWATTTYNGDNTPFEVGFFLLPTREGAGLYPVQYSDELAISSSSEHVDEAMRFVEFFFTDEDTYRTYLEIGGLYATKSPVLYAMPELMTEVVDAVKAETPVRAFMRSPEQPAGFPQLFQRLGQDVFAGLDVTDAMSALEARYRELQQANP